MEHEKTAYLDLLRVAACIMVVGVHVTAFCMEDVPVGGFAFAVMDAFDCFFILGVPLFVMVSGALMLAEDYKTDFKKLYFGKIGRLVILYFFWLLIYNINNYMIGDLNSLKEIVLRTLMGKGIYHLWFLPMTAALYLVTPFIRSFAQDLNKCLWFLGLYFLLAILIPTALLFDFPYRTIVDSVYHQIDNYYIFSGYLGYYVLGHVIHEFMPRLRGSALLALGAAGLVSLGIEIHVCNVYSAREGSLSVILNNPLLLTAFLGTTVLFILGRHLPVRGSRALRRLSGYTLGIYLLHPLPLAIGYGLGWNTLFAPPFISIPLSVILMTAVAFVPIYLLGRIPVVRKLVGMK